MIRFRLSLMDHFYMTSFCCLFYFDTPFLWRFIVGSPLNKNCPVLIKLHPLKHPSQSLYCFFIYLQACGSQHYNLHINLLKGQRLAGHISASWKWIRWEVFKMDLQVSRIKNLCISASLPGDSEYLMANKLFHPQLTSSSMHINCFLLPARWS